MRYSLATLMLFSVPPLMNVLAAPAPEPYAILDIGPPLKGKTAEQFRKEEIERLTHPLGVLALAWHDPEVRKLPSVAPLKDARPWLAKHIRATEEDGGRRLRFTFRAGTRAEQVAILNTLLAVEIRLEQKIQADRENYLRKIEAGMPRLAKLIKDERNVDNLKRWQKEWDGSIVRQTDLRAEIARLKQIAVIRWAK